MISLPQPQQYATWKDHDGNEPRQDELPHDADPHPLRA